MATTKQMTAEDLYELEDHGGHRELIKGELHDMAPTGEEHGEISALLTGLLMVHVRQNKLGTVYAAETGFIIARDPDVVLAPDVAFVRAGRLSADRDRRKFIETPPDLVVEVNSPSDSVGHVTTKVMTYLDTGVLAVWVVDPTRRVVTVYAPDRTARILTTEDELDGGEIVPGFKVSVAELFS